MKKRSAKLSKSASKKPTWNVSSNVSRKKRISVLRLREQNKDNVMRRNNRLKMRRISRSRLLKKPSVRQRRPSVRKRMKRKSRRKERQLLHKHRQTEKLIMLKMQANSKKLHPARPRTSKIIRSRKEKREKDKRVQGRVSLLKRHQSTLELLKRAIKMLKAKTEARAKRSENLRRQRNNSKKSPLTTVLRRSTK